MASLARRAHQLHLASSGSGTSLVRHQTVGVFVAQVPSKVKHGITLPPVGRFRCRDSGARHALLQAVRRRTTPRPGRREAGSTMTPERAPPDSTVGLTGAGMVHR